MYVMHVYAHVRRCHSNVRVCIRILVRACVCVHLSYACYRFSAHVSIEYVHDIMCVSILRVCVVVQIQKAYVVLMDQCT